MLWDFFSGNNGFYKSSITFLSVFYKDSIRNSVRILQGFWKDCKTDFQKGCCRDSEGLWMLSNGIIQGSIPWEFYEDPKGIFMEILYWFLKAQQKSLAIQRPWFYRNVYRAPPCGFILGLFEDRCKDSKWIDGILKDLYKDSSGNSIGFP